MVCDTASAQGCGKGVSSGSFDDGLIRAPVGVVQGIGLVVEEGNDLSDGAAATGVREPFGFALERRDTAGDAELPLWFDGFGFGFGFMFHFCSLKVSF
jgi:hypothetical protein